MDQQTIAGLTGRVITPEDPSYEEERKIWNGMVDKRPAIIVKCRGTDDVIAAVNYAREAGLKATVRGGGHHVAGGALNDGGLVIDLSEMRDVSFDAATKTVRAQGGAQLGDLDGATLPHGRSVPTGVFTETGVAGLTLSGGYGYQSRLHGLTCDSLIGAEVVTADGQLIQAGADENADLFWALRGGGTNLGVVTTFEYQTHPMPPELYVLFVTYPFSEGHQVIRALRDYAASAPNEVGILAVIWTFPEAETFPREIWNQQFVGILATYFGSPEEGERILKPLSTLGTVLFDGSEVQPFAQLQTFFDEDYPKGMRYYWRSTYLQGLSDDAIAALVDLGGRRASPLTSLDIWVLGGAIGDLGPEDTPIAHRHAPFMIGIEANWVDPADDAANIAWAHEVRDVMAPYSTGGSYLNFEDAFDQQRVAAVYGPNYQRLQEIKRKYDPGNLFGGPRRD